MKKIHKSWAACFDWISTFPISPQIAPFATSVSSVLFGGDRPFYRGWIQAATVGTPSQLLPFPAAQVLGLLATSAPQISSWVGLLPIPIQSTPFGAANIGPIRTPVSGYQLGMVGTNLLASLAPVSGSPAFSAQILALLATPVVSSQGWTTNLLAALNAPPVTNLAHYEINLGLSLSRMGGRS